MILQRASAGSGKTYKLAKTYIRLFIAARDEESRRYILRPDKALRECHSHILGVTFTNKATNEMKERIVSKLAALAAPHPSPGREPSDWKAPDYLLDFTGEKAGSTEEDDIIFTLEGRPASRQEISKTCMAALKVLLCDYGHFNISTIDTFFQGVLRTFAYELRLADNYHVEINDDFLARVGVDSTLSLINSQADGSDRELATASYVRQWARSTISEGLSRGENWSMFNKLSSSGTYASLLSMTKKMSLESYKLHAQKLDEYFSDITRFERFYNACLATSAQIKKLHGDAVLALNRLIDAVKKAGGADPNTLFNRMSGAWDAIRSTRPFSALKTKSLGTKLAPYVCADPPEFHANSYTHFLKKSCDPWRDSPAITDLFRDLGHRLWLWQNEREYRETIFSRLHLLGMLHFIRLNSEQFRAESGVIPLSATNDILQRIISTDDTPFIYERIGTRLDHFLLDEFQDTSLMQWRNLIPLLEQSMASNSESLIIGDAKQSIYRFRNAEPDIINHRVVSRFPETRELPSPTATLAERAAVNANHRSAAQIVRTNNTIFTLLPPMLDSSSSPYLTPLYESAVQQVVKTTMPGYVRINFGRPLGADLAETAGATPSEGLFDSLGYLVDDLRSRGFRLSDMAILVDRNNEGTAAIAALMRHTEEQRRLNPDYPPIEVLSEESLKVEDSAAVKVILAVLTAIAKGFRAPESDAPAGDEIDSQKAQKTQIKQYELAQFVAAFQCYFASHREEPVDSILKRDLDAVLPPSELQELMSTAAASTLPAIVEAIARKYTSGLGASQTAYVAAFQDAVLEYCEGYPADIFSFLNWWEVNGSNVAIAAPEGVDALRIMTIHKSKGLEFNAVIIPKADWTLMPAEKDATREIIWSDHAPRGLAGLAPEDIPPVYPIIPSRSMADPASPFHAAYDRYERDHITDQLNKTYVAFTRAGRELHVYAPLHANETDTPYVGDYLNSALSTYAATATADDEYLLLRSSECNHSDGYFSVGSPTTLSPVADEEPVTADERRPIDRDIIIIE